MSCVYISWSTQTYVFGTTQRFTCDAIRYPFVTGDAVFFLETLFTEYDGFRFDFAVEKLNKLWLRVGCGVVDVVETEDTEKL